MIRILSDKEYQRMKNNGWCMYTLYGICGVKKDNQMIELHKRYNTIKKYYTTTSVKGYYNDLWACKNK